MQLQKVSLGAIVVALASTSGAGVVPNIYAGTEGPGTFLTYTSAARTYQYVIDESELTDLVGMNIVGLAMRLNASATVPGPSANMSTTDMEIWIGPGVDPSAMSQITANNFTSAPTLVKDGQHDIFAGSFGIGNPAPFGPMIGTSEYFYNGGDLSILMYWQGWTGATLSLDASTTSSPGYNVTYASRWLAGFNTGTLTNQANFLVTDIIGRPVPEPGTFVAIGLGFGMLALRFRKR